MAQAGIKVANFVSEPLRGETLGSFEMLCSTYTENAGSVEKKI